MLAVWHVGGDLGWEIVYFGGSGYNKHIWDVLVLEGEQEEAGEQIHSPKLIRFFPN